MTTLQQPCRIWLTGATSGIGLALAERLLADGHRVALSARNVDKLNTMAAGFEHALVVPLDVSDRGAVRAAGQRLETQLGGLDVVILNAGTCEYLDARHFDVDLVERVFAPNFFGALYAMEAALPLLRRARDHDGIRPLLAATSSASAYVPLPRAEAYGASKAALSYFLESLRLDLDAEGIDVSVIHPGFVKTPLTERNDFPMPMRISAEQAAEAIVAGLNRRQLDIHFPRRFTNLVRLMGILPPRLRRRLGLRMVKDTQADGQTSGGDA
ncbi:SDR family NAD(P)-dependent oxidoreductase [Halomonas sp. ML-15]|uniref:SDR family NAD(P)-dependent oxidoreductase n=1 Tax=Halomonas sp. ML-15 TaxID=2773305 RepID=UPI0017479572|nr:SDR family NAD(P)-dependent oxidoreductase [Halomonas sp. ML-15]MBD3897990.1 SDR family NAD(P)-dependent oxidoreductase [Halomonas sp. ML-15]